MAKSNRRRRSKKKRMKLLQQPYRFHLYTNFSDGNPRMTGMCYEIEQGRNGFWIRWRQGGNLHFEDHVAYAIIEELGVK